jgi:hypothetical protein
MGVLRSLLDEYTSKPDKTDGRPTRLGPEEIAAEISDLRARIDEVQHSLTFEDLPEKRELGLQDEVAQARGKIGALETGSEILSDRDHASAREALLSMFEEKRRIERYCQWHASTTGRNPLHGYAA